MGGGEAMEHELKIWAEFFEPVITGQKTFELRYDDRGYRAGDVLVLNEVEGGKQTGRSARMVVTYLLTGLGLAKGWVVMAIKPEDRG